MEIIKGEAFEREMDDRYANDFINKYYQKLLPLMGGEVETNFDIRTVAATYRRYGKEAENKLLFMPQRHLFSKIKHLLEEYGR